MREHFDQVELYTDKRGYEVLIEKLHLPYTQVHVIYDDSLCLPQHWAYAKIKTYSLQTEPFLHIDGDMYFPKPISQERENRPDENLNICDVEYINPSIYHKEFSL